MHSVDGEREKQQNQTEYTQTINQRMRMIQCSWPIVITTDTNVMKQQECHRFMKMPLFYYIVIL